jgi:fatty-acyl-CoA synthase
MPTAAFDAQATLDVVESEGVTGLFLVPAQWQAMCAHPAATRRSQSLRTISWGAAPATVTLLQQMAQTFPHADILSAFGQTEMSPVTSILESKDAMRKIGSVGQIVPTVAARIVDDEMNDVAPGEVGEIVYRGPTTMAGYWNKPDETAEAFAGGWFHSGDLVRADDEGFLYVVDRKKDMIISGGENIYCAEVENALAAHPAVAEVAVIGRPHERWGEVPVAVVALAASASSALELTELNEFLTERLARYKHPKALEVVDALPRNPAGKVLKTELRTRFATQEIASADESSSVPTVSAAKTEV